MRSKVFLVERKSSASSTIKTTVPSVNVRMVMQESLAVRVFFSLFYCFFFVSCAKTSNHTVSSSIWN